MIDGGVGRPAAANASFCHNRSKEDSFDAMSWTVEAVKRSARADGLSWYVELCKEHRRHRAHH
jgi:hypothetical protein